MDLTNGDHETGGLTAVYFAVENETFSSIGQNSKMLTVQIFAVNKCVTYQLQDVLSMRQTCHGIWIDVEKCNCSISIQTPQNVCLNFEVTQKRFS